MSQLAFSEFQTKLSEMIDERKTEAIAREAYQKLATTIELITPLLVQMGISQSIQKLRKRKAIALNAEGVNLLEGFDLPLTSRRAATDRLDQAPTIRTTSMTKLEVINKKNELAQLPRRRQRLLAEYTRLLERIDKFCADEEPVTIGLQRAYDAR